MLIIFLAYCVGEIKSLAILYLAVLLHEGGHFIACVALGEKVLKLRFMPYGANLCIENVVNPVYSMIISAAGPLISLLLVCFFGGFTSAGMRVFKASNIAVFALNVFPALPLDGGVFLKSIFTYRAGYIKAHRRAMELTRITAVFLSFFGVIFLLLSKYNISLLVISAFLVYNLKEERKKLIFLRRMIYSKEFDRRGKPLNVKHRAVAQNVGAISLTDYFGYNYICHFFVYDNDMNLLGTLEQSEIIDGIISYGADITVGRLLGGTNEHKRYGVQNITQGFQTYQIHR